MQQPIGKAQILTFDEVNILLPLCHLMEQLACPVKPEKQMRNSLLIMHAPVLEDTLL